MDILGLRSGLLGLLWLRFRLRGHDFIHITIYEYLFKRTLVVLLLVLVEKFVVALVGDRWCLFSQVLEAEALEIRVLLQHFH